MFSLALYSSDTATSRVVQGLKEIDTIILGEFEAGSSMGIGWVYWEYTLRMISNKPIFGSGSGRFSTDYAEIVKNAKGWRAWVTDYPHQQYTLVAG